MLSKPKMPSPYNTTIDATKGLACSCILTEGEVARYETTIMDLYGNTIEQIGNEKKDIGYWASNSKITASIISDNIKNNNEYKWKTRLFEYQDVSVWTAYGTLQSYINDKGTDTKSPIVSYNDTTVTLQVSAHQNIEMPLISTSATDNSFPIYKATEYLNEIDYDPDPLGYQSDNMNDDCDVIYLSDVTSNVKACSKVDPATIFTGENSFSITKDGVKSKGIIDDVIQHPNKTGYQIITIYDFHGYIYHCLTKKRFETCKGYVYDDNGSKKSTECRVRAYKLLLDENNQIWIDDISTTMWGGATCKGKYNSANNSFSETPKVSFSKNTIVISERDYQESKDEFTNKKTKETYHFKYGGKKYLITDFQLMKSTVSTEEDMDLDTYTYAYMTIAHLDGSNISETERQTFSDNTQYTIYSNFIDSDEYYFKTYTNLFSRITFNGQPLDNSVSLLTDLLEGELQGYLMDIDGNLYQNKIVSYEWIISVPTITGSEVIYKSGVKYGNTPYLTYSGFVENQDYLVTLTINSDIGTYTSDTYTIKSQAYVPMIRDGSTDENGKYIEVPWTRDKDSNLEVEVKFNNIKRCVDIFIDDDFRSAYDNLALSLNQYTDENREKHKATFDRIDVFRTSGGTMCHKVASVEPALLSINQGAVLFSIDNMTTTPSNGHIEDYIVGAGNKYEYYVYPVIKFSYDSGNIEYKYTAPLVSNKVTIPLHGVSVIGLVPQTDEDNNIIENSYLIDYENIWHFYLNMKNDSSVLNIAHTIHEGQEKFNKISVGRRGYITSSVSGLLGDVNCPSQEYLDNMESIDLWEKFVNNGELKIICDQYGRILPIDINECNYSYSETGTVRLCTVNFSYIQIADYNDLEILFNNDYIELTEYAMVANGYSQILVGQDSEDTNKALGTLR